MSKITETKIELVTESIEALVLASVIAATAADADRALNHQNVLDARETLKGCLREFLQPVLRVLSSSTRDDSVGDVSRKTTKTVVEERAIFPGGIDDLPCSRA
jgi:hypothetical protein